MHCIGIPIVRASGEITWVTKTGVKLGDSMVLISFDQCVKYHSFITITNKTHIIFNIIYVVYIDTHFLC